MHVESVSHVLRAEGQQGEGEEVCAVTALPWAT